MMDESLVVIVRALISFFTLLLYTRLLGKQQMGNLTYFDYINGITIGSMAGTLATDLSSKAWIHWLGLTVYVVIVFGIQFTDLKNRYFSKIIDGEPAIVMQNAKFLEKNLKKSKLTKDELMMLLREKNIFDPTQVEFAIMEPNGVLSVLPKSEYQPATPKDLHIPVQPAGLTTELIIDGVLLEKNLTQRQKDRQWLDLQLKAKGIKNIKEISFSAILPNGQLYVDTFEDHIGKESDINDYDNQF
ncbi:DUF421 domain-containing protein [Halalkalibacter nanhaiisediminis]|uniref:Uncharacterized membrane protein YcaP (DUF421 family) n=1 Tax=Halalkalibacter nanhaiisediminis TaxID=688079 RepID=A0A562QUS1_9BACI|nr:DUF421 domain-containing protein [Halalkalibacter nanhaiisediminis]TWI60054.1 uncharacterized membrane protein YcaP (DUF421 family) [Halalkalibacter nanhaiisediminis]